MAEINSRSDIQNDGYGHGIIPAETKARTEGEGDSFKELPKSDGETGLKTTGAIQ